MPMVLLLSSWRFTVCKQLKRTISYIHLQNECEHGSTCLGDSLNRVYSCVCPDGNYGNRCEQTDYCHGLRCQNGADCVNLDNSY